MLSKPGVLQNILRRHEAPEAAGSLAWCLKWGAEQVQEWQEAAQRFSAVNAGEYPDDIDEVQPLISGAGNAEGHPKMHLPSLSRRLRACWLTLPRRNRRGLQNSLNMIGVVQTVLIAPCNLRLPHKPPCPGRAEFSRANLMTTSTVNEQLSAVARHLHEQREAILSSWRRGVDMDPILNTGSAITRSQFNDHIPAVLDAFERRLCAEDSGAREKAREDERQNASEHGLHRWQQGYNLPEAMCEWGHLHLSLLHEIERFGAAHPHLLSSVVPTALRALVRLCSDGVCASATRYVQLQQTEAGSRLRDLETALKQVQHLERDRAEAWREASHDLKGTAHVIAIASNALNRDGVSESKFAQYSEILRVEVASLGQLVTDLMDQARLEAGHERRNVSAFDVAAHLKDFCDSMRPATEERGLFLEATGPASLTVEGDAVKVRRIVQNLVLNALKATVRGGIRVTWEPGTGERQMQWILCVQDTGPGFNAKIITPIEHALQAATNEAHAVEAMAREDGQNATSVAPAPTLTSQSDSRTFQPPAGEGIGLSIVKRLCELLDASIELETAAGAGTTFRVTFPRAYQS